MNRAPLDMTTVRFLTPEEVAALFRRDLRWVYRQSARTGVRDGLLTAAARRFGTGERKKMLLFERAMIEAILDGTGPEN